MAKAAVEEDNLVIPLIDFGSFLSGNESTKKEIASQILLGFQTAGFIYLTNHGISKPEVTEVFTRSSEFFKLPQAQKNALGWTSARANRGYVAHGREKVSMADVPDVAALREANPDLKESLEIGREGEEGCPNQWPPVVPASSEAVTTDAAADVAAAKANWPVEFRETMQDFFDKCKELHIEVMRSIAVGLGIEQTFFDGFTNQGDNTLRLLHYPAVKRDVFEKNTGQVRAGEHTDYGSITLLFQDMRGGLQVESPNGNYIDAKPIEDAIVVNAGDLLARWSNDTIKSTKHRVVEPPNKAEEYPARYSVAYFCNPNFDKLIEAIPGTCTDAERKYQPINSGAYLVQRLEATY